MDGVDQGLEVGDGSCSGQLGGLLGSQVVGVGGDGGFADGGGLVFAVLEKARPTANGRTRCLRTMQ